MRSQILCFALFFCFGVFGQIYNANVNLMNEAYYDVYGKTPAQVHQENFNTIKKFVAMDVDTNRDNAYMRPKFISPMDAMDVYQTASYHPVVSLYQYNKYDPKNQGIGFCFGRAMYVNVDLAYRGIDRDSVKKAFVVGSMSTGDGNTWGWHVTTIAQSKDVNGQEEWLAIDPITGVKTLTEWYLEMYNDLSTDKLLKLYITEAGKFGPNGARYEEEHLKDKFYNNYFTDMMNWFREASKDGFFEDKKFVEYAP